MNRKSAVIDVSSLPVAPLDLSRPAAEQIASALKTAILNMQIEPWRDAVRKGGRAGFRRQPHARARGVRAIARRRAASDMAQPGHLCLQAVRTPDPRRPVPARGAGGRGGRAALHGRATRCLARWRWKTCSRASAPPSRRAGNWISSNSTTGSTRYWPRRPGSTGSAGCCCGKKRRWTGCGSCRWTTRTTWRGCWRNMRASSQSIRNGYTGQALDRMRRHLRRVLATLSDLIEANRDFFDDPEG